MQPIINVGNSQIGKLLEGKKKKILRSLKQQLASIMGKRRGREKPTAVLRIAQDPTPVLSPGKSHGWRSLVGCSPWGR